MLKRIWQTARTVLIVLGTLLTFFAVIEVIRAYEVLRDLHPVLGTAFAWLLLLGAIAFGTWYCVTLGRRSSALTAPSGVDPAAATGRGLHLYARFQLRLLKRLSQNKRLSDAQREPLQSHAITLRDAMRAIDDETLSSEVLNIHEEVIPPVVARLDEDAQAEVSRCVRDVMLFVTVSPWRSVDLLVVLYRNLRMVMQLTAIYDTRPSVRGQLAIMRDVLTIVATVNFLNYGSNLLQNLASSVPLLGRFADDIAQGVGAGLLTSVAGHAAVERCRAYRGWDAQQAEESIRERLLDFVTDVKVIVTNDVLQRIRKPVEAQYPEAERPPDMISRIRDGITSAMDETTAAMDFLIVRPVTVAGRGVAGAGAALGNAVVQGGAATVKGINLSATAAGRFVGDVTFETGRALGRAVTGTGKFVIKGTTAAFRQASRAIPKRRNGSSPDDDTSHGAEQSHSAHRKQD
jgi:hypothetical protein